MNIIDFFDSVGRDLRRALLRNVTIRSVGCARRVWLLPAVVLAPITALPAEGASLLELTKFERLYIEGRASPPNDVQEGWEPCTLKDVWSLRRRAVHQEAWYQTSFRLPHRPTEEFSLYVPRVSAAASFWVNGLEVGSTGGFEAPIPRNWNHPLRIPVPARVLRAGDNRLEIRLKVMPSALGYLYEVTIGPTRLVKPLHNRSYFAKVTAVKILTTVMAISAVVLLAFYFTTQLPRTYLWFALGSLAWTLYSFDLFISEIPVSMRTWRLYYIAALMAAVVFYMKSSHAALRLRRSNVEIMLVLFSIAILTAIATFPPLHVALAVGICALVVSGIVLYLGSVLCFHGWERRRENGSWMVFAGAATLVLMTYDIVAGGLHVTTVFAKYPYIPLAVTVSGGSAFVAELIRIARDRESYPQRTKLASVQAVASERRRLMQEIHDGVGGQLISALAALERSPHAHKDAVRALRTSLNDLRLIVHSLETMSQQGDIVTILATIRERLEGGLNRQGIQFDWRVRPILKVEPFGSEDALQLMRIVQEAITNSIRHASAKRIRLETGAEERHGRRGIFILIADDGGGSGSGGARRIGCGLRSMRERARKLGAAFELDSDPRGTRIRLWLPEARGDERADRPR